MTHAPAMHAWPSGQAPQSRAAPQPSSAAPQTIACAGQSSGTQAAVVPVGAPVVSFADVDPRVGSVVEVGVTPVSTGSIDELPEVVTVASLLVAVVPDPPSAQAVTTSAMTTVLPASTRIRAPPDRPHARAPGTRRGPG
jgi:hypothetical protein